MFTFTFHKANSKHRWPSTHLPQLFKTLLPFVSLVVTSDCLMVTLFYHNGFEFCLLYLFNFVLCNFCLDTSLLPLWSFWSWNTLSSFPPQGVHTFCFLFQELPFPTVAHRHLFPAIKIPAQMSPPWEPCMLTLSCLLPRSSHSQSYHPDLLSLLLFIMVCNVLFMCYLLAYFFLITKIWAPCSRDLVYLVNGSIPSARYLLGAQ